MRLLLLISLFTLSACKHHIDVNSIELREHGLSYLKGTNTLVDGKVVRKMDGRIIELNNYKAGKMIGDFFQYGPQGQVLSHGFGVEIKDYEIIVNGDDLTYCILSIVEIQDNFSYATLYMDNQTIFAKNDKLIQLARSIFVDYGDKYKFDHLLVFDNNHEYTVLKSAISNLNYTIDTIPDTKTIKLEFH